MKNYLQEIAANFFAKYFV